MVTSISDTTMALVLILSILLVFCSGPAIAELTRIDQPTKSDGSLSLLVVGDWGRRGNYNQSLVATQMGRIGEELDIDFVISTGDNFYENGLTGVNDTAFEESFSNIYTAKSLHKPCSRNHDYRGDVLAQLSDAVRRIDPRFTCMRSFIVNAEIADFFFVDTTPFVNKYWTDPEDHHYDWREVSPRETYIENLSKDLDSALKESVATWKIVVGHHTMRSAHEVDFYVNGHDHCLEHISSIDSPIQYFTSGGGSKAWRGAFRPNSDMLQFFYDGQGFMSLRLSPLEANFVFYDAFGRVLYEWGLAKVVTRKLFHPAAM
ncbi:Purple acid phosphatase 3 [Ananas comosus]|uniref:Purple acid phosphatase n=1 Tax=Ananas comosus TaxID=4615 RepID=A0A199VTZ6_ANACO|nr:Purple acid phosphatase 3 [Ananas comosus]